MLDMNDLSAALEGNEAGGVVEAPEDETVYDICVVGFGAIGAIYSLVLEKSEQARVTAVCRSNYGLLTDHGVDVHSGAFGSTKHGDRIEVRRSDAEPIDNVPDVTYPVVSSPAEAADRTYEYIVCCFKTLPDVISTPKLLGPLLTKSKAFVLIQNGIGIERDLQEALAEAQVHDAVVMSACAWIDTTVIDGGRTIKHGTLEQLVIGYHRPLVSAHHSVNGDIDSPKPNGTVSVEEQAGKALETFANLLVGGGANPAPTANIEAERWRKVLWNVAYSTLCTLAKASVPELLATDVASATAPVIKGLMQEERIKLSSVVKVARAAGIDESLLPDSAIDDTIKFTDLEYDPAIAKQENRVPHKYRPSMLVDYDFSRPMEVEAIVGGIQRIARELNVQTPQLDVVYATLKVIQHGFLTARQINGNGA